MIETLISSSVLIGLICLLRAVLRGRINPRLQYGLWGVAAVRLIIPWMYPLKELLDRWNTRLSVMNAARTVREQVIAGTAAEYLADNLETGHVYHFGEETVGLVEKAAGIDWQLWITVIWIAGFLILLGWMITVNLRFDRMLKKRRIPYTGVLPEFVNRPVWLVEGLSSPCYEGLGSYEAIYLPAELAEDQEKLRHALAHETGHVLQHDRGWGILRCVLLCYYWVNPFVWAAAILSKRDCELACDERAIGLLGEEERFAYGKTLVGLIASQGMGHGLFSAATTMAAGKRTVKERIQILARAPRTTGIMLGTVFAAALLLVACTFSGAEETAETGAEERRTLISVEGWEAAVPIESGDADGEADAAGVGGNSETADEDLRPIGEGDELVLIRQERWGNYHELTFRRQDRETGDALTIDDFSFEREGQRGNIELFEKADGSKGSGYLGSPSMGWGGSQGSRRAEKTVALWNVENAGAVRYTIREGQREISCIAEIKNDEPVQSYRMNMLLPVEGADGQALALQNRVWYPNAVWIQGIDPQREADSQDLEAGTPQKDSSEAASVWDCSIVLQVGNGEDASRLYTPVKGFREDERLDYMFTFSEDLFPENEIRAMAVREDRNLQQEAEPALEPVSDPELEQTIRGFVEAYMAGDMEKAARYSTITDLDPSDVIVEKKDGSHRLRIMSEEEPSSGKVFVSYQFIAEDETDSYTFLSMTAERLDGIWKITEAGFEK